MVYGEKMSNLILICTSCFYPVGKLLKPVSIPVLPLDIFMFIHY